MPRRSLSSSRLVWIMLLSLVMAACGAPATESDPTATSAPDADASPTTGTSATAAPTTNATPSPQTPSDATPATGGADQGPCTPAAASTAPPTGLKRLVVGTGGTGGVFYPYGGGIARILTEKLADTEATAEVTGGSVDNLKLIQANEADIGLSTVDSAYDALLGQGSYAATGAVPACALAAL